MAVLLIQVTVAHTEMMHFRQKWAAEERQYRAQDTQLGRAAERSSAENSGVGKEGGTQGHRAGTREGWSLQPAPQGSTLLVAPVGSPGPARARPHGREQQQGGIWHP